MMIFTAVTTYRDGLFGSYSSLLRARKAVEWFLHESVDVVSFEDTGNYSYKYTTVEGETHSISILTDTLDWEFETGEINENN